MELVQVDMGIYHLKMHFKLVSNQMSQCYLGSESKTSMIKLFFEVFIANYFYTFNKKDPVVYMRITASLLVHLLAEWRNNSLRHEVGHLGLVAADGQVGDGPGRLLLSLELPLGQVGDDHGHQPRLDHGLHLLLVARSDVGQEPNCLLNIIKSINLSQNLLSLSSPTLFIFSLAWLRREGKCSRAP